MAIVPEDGSSGCDGGEQIADYLRLVPSPWLQICSFVFLLSFCTIEWVLRLEHILLFGSFGLE
jgi:hypothetical protein